MKRYILLIYVQSILFYGYSQPYGGTIFVDPDIITESDSSALESVSYTGQGNRTIFDRRINNWITVNAFLFNVVWNDGLVSEAVVNPEFGTIDASMIEAERYGFSIGQLPYCLRTDVDEIWINKGIELFGGGNNSILIHTGQTVNYEADGILEETLVHEASHTSLDATHAFSSGWLEAQMLDGGFISDYAEEFPDREDIAESFLMWLAVRYRTDKISARDQNLITSAISNRLAYFDGINCNLSPFVVDNDDDEVVLTIEGDSEIKIRIFPNPTKNHMNIHLMEEGTFELSIHDANGSTMLERKIVGETKIDLSAFSEGVYFLIFKSKAGTINHRIIKR